MDAFAKAALVDNLSYYEKVYHLFHIKLLSGIFLKYFNADLQY
jgi:hypothetical protein